MKLCRPLLALLSFLSFSYTVAAQPFSIKGSVTDTLNANRLRFASVTLLRASDSILETFTRTKEDGGFALNVKKEGSYIIMVTFPSFADYIDIVTVNESKPLVDMGVIPMVSKSHLLSEFVLKQQIGAIKIKGDTTEYVADSFKVRENATVEELLKKLPGIQVNKNGEVVAQGEKVQKILVDGEEFFTDDPAVVTKSLQAKAVDKVQVFDKKSDQSQFTGIDDGTREKTINLQLKDNMKKGYFGKINAGGGTDGFFENQAMINAFKGKRKLSAFGIAANTGKMGLGWEDRDKFGGNSGSTTEVTDDGMMISYYSSGDDNFESWNGQYNGQGIPTAWTGGLHYSNKWNNDDLHLSSNYRFGKQNIDAVGNTLTQVNTNSNSDIAQYYNDEKKNSFSTGQRHRVDGLFEWKLDSTSSLKITANASTSNTQTTTNYHTEIYDTLRTRSITDRLTTSDALGKTVNASLAYRKKFAKKGRTLSLTIDEWYKENVSDGVLRYDSDIFLQSNPSGGIDTINNSLAQKKRNDSKNLQITGNISYTEPLSNVVFLELNYGLGVNNSYAKRLSFNENLPEGDPHYLDTLFSSDYDFNVLTNKGGTNLRFVFKKVNFSFGGAVSAVNFKQIDNFSSDTNVFRRNYTNFFPRASFVYRASQQKSFSLNYNGNTTQPTIDQIQPLRQNTDPNNISIGNDSLKQKFNHSFNFRFNDYKVISGTYTYLGGGFTFVKDDISRSEMITDGGARIYQYINVNGNYNGWAYGGYGWNFRKLDLRFGFNGNINVGRTITYVNGVRNENNNNTYSLGVGLNYDKEKKFNLSYNPRVSFSNNTASINQSTTNYWTLTNEFDANIQLPWKFEIGTEVEWNLRERVAEFDQNNSIFLWTAYLSKKFMKNNQLELRATAYDILNQNVGYRRFGIGGNITEQSYNTIRRYGMLSLIWNFTKAPAAVQQENNTEFKIKL
ncbi:MAG TPA: TonB-dependent receptor [Flavipsychrobacter sp.]|nr:TonB-dependent receptor [Flavipsychrobacter sp.]